MAANFGVLVAEALGNLQPQTPKLPKPEPPKATRSLACAGLNLSNPAFFSLRLRVRGLWRAGPERPLLLARQSTHSVCMAKHNSMRNKSQKANRAT